MTISSSFATIARTLRVLLLALSLAGIVGCQSPGKHAPSGSPHTLRRGGLEVVIETAPAGYLQKFGPRFDRTAVVRQITLGQRNFLGPWGLPDEFGINGDGVLGFSNAPVGGEFVKIGVGRLIRNQTNAYTFWQQYPVSTLFPVKTVVTSNTLTLCQSTDGGLPWHYSYTKSYTLVADDTLEIRYTLTNTGTNIWSFEHYNHHWFSPDAEPVGPVYALETQFTLPAGETAFIRTDHELRLANRIPTNSPYYLAGDLTNTPAQQNSFTLTLHGRPAIIYQGSFAPAHFAAYAESGAFCPEVFRRATIRPGESVHWSARYRFMTEPKFP
jgi:hypothetical protein